MRRLAPIVEKEITENSSDNRKSNTAYLNKYFLLQLTDLNAPIFATFGHKDPRHYIQLNINGDNVLALLDCGSTKTYVGEKASNLLGNFENTNLFMRAANNNLVKVDGLKSVKFSLCGVENTVPTRYIQSLQYQMILGLDFLSCFKLTVDYGSGTCSLPGGRLWKVDFPDDAHASAFPLIDSISAVDSESDPRIPKIFGHHH